MVAACAPSTGAAGDSVSQVAQATDKPSLVVWADQVRSDMVQKYKDSHPDVNVDIVTIPYTISTYEQKLSLANQAGKGWPDVFGVPGALLSAFAIPPYDFAADITNYLPKDFGANFSKGSMTQCQMSGKIVCVPYQVSPFVLFYNVPLMKQFGYTVPTTWEEYEQLGLSVAKEHPGYVVGAAAEGGVVTSRAYLAPARCPDAQLVDSKTIFSNLADPNCTRAVTMMDKLIKTGVLPTEATSDPDFIKNYGSTGKWLTLVEPIFQIKNLFENQFKTPKGVLGMAPPLKWADEDQAYTGRTAGTAFMVSKHSKYQQAATDLALWLAEGPVANDPTTVTVPAYKPALNAWTDAMQKSGYVTVDGGTVASVFDTAINATWADQSDVPVDGIDFKAVVGPLLAKGGTVASALPAWTEAIKNQSKAAGFTVVDHR